MPYTFAHIGFVIPFKKKLESYFSSTGLVFGCIAPDYDILFRLTRNRFHIFNYDLQTIVLFIFPLAFISAVAFHLFCRKIILQNLPDLFQQKYIKYTKVDLKNIFINHFFKMCFSILFAILLHLFLDYLCHYVDAYDAKMYALKYTQNTIIIRIVYLSAIYLLPVLFTLSGFYIIYISFQKTFKSIADIHLSKEKIYFWLFMVIITLIIIGLKFFSATIEKEFIVDFFIISTTSSFIIAFYLTCIFYYILYHTKHKKMNNASNS